MDGLDEVFLVFSVVEVAFQAEVQEGHLPLTAVMMRVMEFLFVLVYIRKLTIIRIFIFMHKHENKIGIAIQRKFMQNFPSRRQKTQFYKVCVTEPKLRLK